MGTHSLPRDILTVQEQQWQKTWVKVTGRKISAQLAAYIPIQAVRTIIFVVSNHSAATEAQDLPLFPSLFALRLGKAALLLMQNLCASSSSC